MHREGIRGMYPTPGSPCRTWSQVFSSNMQHISVFTGDQRCWDHEGSDWSPAAQSHSGSRVEVTDFQGQNMAYCQDLSWGKRWRENVIQVSGLEVPTTTLYHRTWVSVTPNLSPTPASLDPISQSPCSAPPSRFSWGPSHEPHAPVRTKRA